ncbi:hypothetical protein [Pleionea sp. CnH1-48]|uniref:hypothetical protein n=1 Tax=Pleionea sp. CnH1-48 TaxID=2954494 RepID=UPI002097BAD7|nr:hypothetical protein [Pleionea sp. CnH1-48]MCO7224809.1 hypothetical protein [Pleionea sp. CnH1-48]
MDKECLSYNFKVGLYAYLVQCERSVQRSHHSPWNNFIKYSNENIPSPSIIIEALRQDGGIKTLDLTSELLLDIENYLRERASKNMVLKYVYGMQSKLPPLTEEEIVYISSALKALEGILNRDRPSVEKIIQVRKGLLLASFIMQSKFLPLSKVVERVNKVTHFNQSLYLECLTIRNIIGEKWLY